jgi:hypothetical protein
MGEKDKGVGGMMHFRLKDQPWFIRRMVWAMKAGESNE